jgi:hypothetical protein
MGGVMEQPKFKFGDTLVFKITKKKFTVKAISQDFGMFLYGEDSRNGREMYMEDFCELYQEPQKKKLYAYQWDTFRTGKNTSRMIAFFECESLIAERRPEYDIEYPSP